MKVRTRGSSRVTRESEWETGRKRSTNRCVELAQVSETINDATRSSNVHHLTVSARISGEKALLPGPPIPSFSSYGHRVVVSGVHFAPTHTVTGRLRETTDASADGAHTAHVKSYGRSTDDSNGNAGAESAR